MFIPRILTLRSRCAAVASFSAVVAAISLAPDASAATKDWKLLEGGNFSDTTAWSPTGAPADADDARFDLAGSYTLTLDRDRQTRRLLIGDDKLVLDLATFDYRLTGSTGPSMVMGLGTADVARLTVKNGDLHTGPASLAAATKSVGSVTVAGTWQADGLLTVGRRGTGNVTVAGGTVSAAGLKLASVDGSRGSILLSGDDARLLVDTSAVIGNGTKASGTLAIRPDTLADVRGTLTINPGGDVRLEGGSLSVGRLVNKAGGKFTFDSGVLGIENANLVVGGGGLFGKSLSLTPGKAIEVARATRIDAGAALDVSNGKFTSAQMVNNGTIRLRGGRSVLAGSVRNAGEIAVRDSTVRIAAAIVQEGTFSTTPNAKSIFRSPVTGAGHFTGGGTVRFESSYAPGDADDFVRITGDVEFAPTADLVLAAGGNDERARLRVFGDAILGDVVVNVDPADVVPGVPITLVRAASLSRAGDIVVNGLEPGQYDLVESGTSLILVPLDEQQRFASVGGVVPEPGTFGMLGLAAAAGLLRRRRH